MIHRKPEKTSLPEDRHPQAVGATRQWVDDIAVFEPADYVILK